MTNNQEETCLDVNTDMAGIELVSDRDDMHQLSAEQSLRSRIRNISDTPRKVVSGSSSSGLQQQAKRLLA